MTADLVQRAHWGDLSGMHFAGLVRLSFEAGSTADRSGHMTGRDIKGRSEQEKDCRRYVEGRSGSYVYTYEEPDTSAYKRRRVRLPDGRTVYRVVRPIFEGALEDLKRGVAPDGSRLDGLVVYDIDRLTRDNRHLEDAIEVVEHFGRPIVDITGTLDLLTDNGRTVARIVVATYNKQSADTARRVSRKHRALEQAGIPTGGWRPFGWNADKRTLNPAEAEEVRKAAKRIIGGAPLVAIVADWNARGILTPRGNAWVLVTLKYVFRNPRVCGYRARNRLEVHADTGKDHKSYEIVLDEAGQPVRGQWEPILSVAEWEAVTAIIGANSVAGRGVNVRKYLLSGTLRCGKNGCGTQLRAIKAPKYKSTETTYCYGCPGTSAGGCGGTYILGPPTDEAIEQLVIEKYELEAARRNAKHVPQQWAGDSDLASIRRDIAELTEAWRTKQISGARYFPLLADLERQEHDLTAQREQWNAREYAAGSRPVDLRAKWPGMTLAEKRAYIEDALIAVVLHPKIARSKRWDPTRLEPIWRED